MKRFVSMEMYYNNLKIKRTLTCYKVFKFSVTIQEQSLNRREHETDKRILCRLET